MDTKRLEEWIRQYNLLEKLINNTWEIVLESSYSERKITDSQKFKNGTVESLEDRKKELLRIIIKEAKEGAFD